MSGIQKKKRGPNFSHEEKVLVLELCKKYQDVLENKRTDAVTWREKNEAWCAIEKEFNGQSVALVHRSHYTLKLFYEGKKKEARKVAAGDRCEHIKDPTIKLTLALLNKKTVDGLDRVCDGDTPGSNNDRYPLNDLNNDFSALSPLPSSSFNEETDIEIITYPLPSPSEPLPHTSVVTPNGQSSKWNHYDRSQLRTAKHSALQRGQSCVRSSRLPQLTPTRTRPYQDLCSTKHELAKLQIEVLQEEAEQKKTLFHLDLKLKQENLKLKQENLKQKKALHDLNKTNLELEIQLKVAQLELLKNKYRHI